MMSVRLDGRLDDADSALLDEHMAGCEECQGEWERVQAIDRLLSAAPVVQAPVRVRVQVMTRLERRDKARRALVGGTALTLGTVALAVLAVSPLLLGLLNVTGIAPALIHGGPKTVSQLVGYGGTMGRTCIGMVDSLVIPLVAIGLCGLVSALVLNGIWIGAMRRLRAPR
jgi:predicted anti-sigma-YlaC factor YlaD